MQCYQHLILFGLKMAIKKGHSPKIPRQEIPRILESNQERNCQEMIKSIHFHFLDLIIKTSQETTIKARFLVLMKHYNQAVDPPSGNNL